MSAIVDDSIAVFESDGVVVHAPRALAAVVNHPELREVDTDRGRRTQLVGDDEVLGTFAASGVPLAEVAGERWESLEGGWYLAVVEHGHWVYVFEADGDALAVLDGMTTCQQHGRHGDVRADHVEAVWHCIPVDTYRSLWVTP